jgi:hypothetical protein
MTLFEPTSRRPAPRPRSHDPGLVRHRARRTSHHPDGPRADWSARDLVLVMNGMLVGIGGVFAATTSVLVTAIAAGAALCLCVTIVMTRR